MIPSLCSEFLPAGSAHQRCQRRQLVECFRTRCLHERGMWTSTCVSVNFRLAFRSHRLVGRWVCNSQSVPVAVAKTRWRATCRVSSGMHRDDSGHLLDNSMIIFSGGIINLMSNADLIIINPVLVCRSLGDVKIFAVTGKRSASSQDNMPCRFTNCARQCLQGIVLLWPWFEHAHPPHAVPFLATQLVPTRFQV